MPDGPTLEERMVSEGSPAPEFSLRSDTGETVSLSSLRGKPVVLYFYPKDDTPGCTAQACAVRDSWTDFEKAGAVVLGVSPDGEESHVKFRDKFNLPFTLLSDPDRVAAKAYDVWVEKTNYGKTSMGIQRSTFVIDADGSTAKVLRNVKPDTHAEKVLEALAAL
jgi:thioredoxin-dependent peroxiredoxin